MGNIGRVIPTAFHRGDGSIDVSLEFQVSGDSVGWHRENTTSDSAMLLEVCEAFGVSSPDELSSTWRAVDVDSNGRMILPTPAPDSPEVVIPEPEVIPDVEPTLPLEGN